ncbi:MAG: type IV secretion system DNA-binding domain-containing protein [Candidatus Nomurabacteria bacterium]|nr:type IV secretion system DNA-binding domain-containing protein [Candidatus Nomurabacteria bacterium]
MDKDEIPQNRDITYFAKTNFRSSNNVFGVKRKDRRQHMYILGKSGTGKSVLLSNLIAQNIQNGEGVCVVDPHGELVEEILHLIPDNRIKDVIYFNPADTDFHIGFNVLQIDDPKYKHLVASGLMGIFTKIWANAWSSRMEYILNNSILALLDTPGTTLLGIPRLLVDKDYRQMIIANLKDPVVKAFWVHEYEQWRDQFRNEAIAPIQNKVGQFLSTSIIRNVLGQPKSTIDIFKIMNEGKIFLVNVSKGRIGEDNSALLGGMIITKIQLAAMERVRIPEEDRKDFYLYVDEFQNFATDSFANILSEARKYRLNLTVAHQYTAQLENKDGSKVRDAVFGNVGTMIVFRVGADDADFLEKEFEPEFVAQDLVNLPNYNIYLKLMIDGITSRPFSATTLPPIKIDVSKGVKEKIIESSRNLFTRPREEVENEISRWSGMLQVGEGDAKYKADCSNCKKSTMVPFEPKEGRPVYCKECMFKIKSGELKPETGFVASRSANQEEKVSTAPLAALGIEFKPVEVKATIPSKNNFPNNFKKDTQPNPKVFVQKPIVASTVSAPVADKKKHTGPSPLLKGLLEQIAKEAKTESAKEKIITEGTIAPNIAPISLSSLKKHDTNNKYSSTLPSKEASEENKTSLKDVLARAAMSQKIDTDINDKKIKEEVSVKSEPVIIPKIEKEIDEIKESNKIHIVKKEEPSKEEKEIKQDEDKNIAWQKPKAKREVPEDVLRKVLE